MTSITQTMVPSQRQAVQSVPNPREFGPNDWKFNVYNTQRLNWMEGNAIESDFNMFALTEPYQDMKNGMFNPLSGQEPINGHVNYTLNPLAQEQTNAHMSAYKDQMETRVAGFMNPLKVMRYPAYTYPVTPWQVVYKGSTAN